MMEQSQTLDPFALEAAATLVAEQMVSHDNESAKTQTCSTATEENMVVLDSVEDSMTTTTTITNVIESKGSNISLSAAEARKRRKDILNSHRKSNELEQANNAVVNAVLDDPSVDAALAYKRKHEAISKATETIIPEPSTPTTGAAVLPPPVATLMPPISTGNASIASSGSLCDGAGPTGPSSISGPQMLNAVTVVTTDGKCKKTQIRYEPTVPMDKDQLTAWRREARRVRNRESAAASRMKTKERIQELEEQVGNWKQKYLDAMDRLKDLEGQQH